MNSLVNPVKKIKILERQSEFCKLFTNVYRLQILYVLTHDQDNGDEDDVVELELTVTQILDKIHSEFDIDLSQTTLSQHLSILRKNKAIIPRRDGNNIYYRIANMKLIQTCGMVREIIMDTLKEEAELSEE